LLQINEEICFWDFDVKVRVKFSLCSSRLSAPLTKSIFYFRIELGAFSRPEVMESSLKLCGVRTIFIAETLKRQIELVE
jgi:hypothetical protein